MSPPGSGDSRPVAPPPEPPTTGASSRIAFAAAASWLGRLLSVAANLFLMPILFRHLGKEELGIWFLLSGSTSFLALFGVGILPTLTRRIALARGSATVRPDGSLDAATLDRIADLVVTGRTMLRGVAVLLFVVAWTAGYFLISQLRLETVSLTSALLAWTVMCAGYAILVWVSYLSAWLNGLGFVGWDGLVAALVGVTAVLASLAAVLLGGGLLSLATVSIASGLAQRVILVRILRKRRLAAGTPRGRFRREEAAGLLRASLHWWLTDLGAFLILRTDAYFIALLLGSRLIPSYQAAYSLIANVFLVSVTFASASAVFVSQAWQKGDHDGVRHLALRAARIGLALMGAGVGTLLVLGREFVDLWLGPGNFVGYPVFVLFCAILTLEAQHTILSSSSRATEDEKYAIPAMSAGVLNLVFTWLLVGRYGLVGIAAGTLLAQLLTNNWYAVYRPFRRLGLSGPRYLREVVATWAFLLGATAAAAALARWMARRAGLPLGWTVLSGALSAGGLVAAVFWIAILEPSEKRRLLEKGAAVLGLRSLKGA